MWDKKDLRYTDTGFFNFEGWLKLLNINPDTDSKIIIITATRNMGKSQGIWTWVYNQYWQKYNHKRKAAFIRTNDIKMKESTNTFKSAYNGTYDVVNGIIYNYIKDDKDRPLRDTYKEIGRFVNVENEHNFRSGVNKPMTEENEGDFGGFNNYHFVFWDEFNETKQGKTDLYQKFLMLLSTIKRKNNPFIMVLIGNKIDANNDIFVKLNLNTNDHDLNNDYIQWVNKDIVYVDIGYNTYKHITDQDDLVNSLASFDHNTNSMFNEGGFLYGQAYNVRNPKVFLENHIKTIGYFALNQIIMEYGMWDNNGEEHYYIRDVYDIKNVDEKYEIIALNNVSYAIDKRITKFDEDDDIIDMLDILYTKLRNNTLFFDGFWLKAVVEEMLYRKEKVFNE